MKPVNVHGLPVSRVFGCHQCEGDATHPIQWVGRNGRVFVFCDNDCLRTWINKGEERVVREVHQEEDEYYSTDDEEDVTDEEKAEYEREVKEAFAEETEHYRQYGTLENFTPKQEKERW